MKIDHLVSTLDGHGLLEYDYPGPWPGEPEGEDPYAIDWSQVNAPLDDAGASDLAVENDAWGPVRHELDRRASGGPYLPPPNVFDALAWYLPIHYYWTGWAIYIKEEAVLELATAIVSLLPTQRQAADEVVWGAVRAGLGILYLHEAFHHKVESLAIRLEIIDHTKRYGPYHRRVYEPAIDTDELLEETLACADSVRRLKGEEVYKRGIPDDVRAATDKMLAAWLPTLPPGYRNGHLYRTDGRFKPGSNLLASQLEETTAMPSRDNSEWHLFPHGYHGLFDCLTATHILVPVGTSPIVPWFNSGVRPISVSTRKMLKLLTSAGFTEVGGGKGSHIKMRGHDGQMVIVPANREALSPSVLRNTAQALGFRSVADLAKAIS